MSSKYQYVIAINNIVRSMHYIEDLSGYENTIKKEAEDLEIATTPALKNAEGVLEEIYSDISITKSELENYSLDILEDVEEYLSLLDERLEAISDYNDKCDMIEDSKLNANEFIRYSMRTIPGKKIKPEDLF